MICSLNRLLPWGGTDFTKTRKTERAHFFRHFFCTKSRLVRASLFRSGKSYHSKVRRNDCLANQVKWFRLMKKDPQNCQGPNRFLSRHRERYCKTVGERKDRAKIAFPKKSIDSNRYIVSKENSFSGTRIIQKKDHRNNQPHRKWMYEIERTSNKAFPRESPPQHRSREIFGHVIFPFFPYRLKSSQNILLF